MVRRRGDGVVRETNLLSSLPDGVEGGRRSWPIEGRRLGGGEVAGFTILERGAAVNNEQ